MVNQLEEGAKFNRQRKVLNLIVKHHIRTAEPISSQLIARDMKLSSATIRNIMYDLEEEGFIRQPHASAGRIPTAKGYRIYVDSIMEPKYFLDHNKGYIYDARDILRSDSIEDVLLKSLQLCSRVTSQACMALFPTLRIKELLIERLEEKIKSALISLYDFDNRLYLDGTHYLIEQPEFKDIDKMCSLLKALEDKKMLRDILEESQNENIVNIFIGSENRTSGFDDCTLITSSYNVDGDITGALGVIGPMRMEYEKVIPVVRGIADSVSRLFDEML